MTSDRWGIAALLVALALVPLGVHDSYLLHVMILIFLNIMLATSMWLLGITHLISFGQAGFMFIGAMTSALLTKDLGVSFWIALPIAGVLPAAIAAPVGRLSLRVRGVYFFLVTLAFGEVVRGIFAYFQTPFGGWYGIRDIPPPSPRWLFTPLDKVPFYYLGLVLVVLTCWVIWRISRSWFGEVLWSIRESELLASSVGINVTGYKLVAFIISAFVAGLAGSFYANYVGYISPLIFDFQYSVSILIFIVVGGFSTLAGPVVGAVVLTIVPELFRATGKYQMLIFGMILVVSMLTMPDGITGAIRRLRRRRAA
ncbi:MAG TPA: branched-chain amino acid ABC transporter permease [Rhodopila sp.]|uniref:branched-chain amino acid ABC transporter permease n=1 Tax=Rhodopila sp. TaxID=2480087 RepID=UPI002CA01B0C|nr:branched-chain amino acid ABC transporter permease [Rhodopila sp.]HVY14324.1 branched-chain amino acid ABC transporter permease [Rhodopila sp.]